MRAGGRPRRASRRFYRRRARRVPGGRLPVKKVRARIGSVPVSLREDAPNGTQRRTTRRLKAVGASPESH
ncbi:hypothetical protein C7S15_3893 [Burkholderia cepacia]|nr:hypothetical protein [Burkholderia cepacia]